MEAVEKRKRKFLLVMATGTGKTRVCIALVDALMRAGWAERVLFLVDRIALRDQTLDAFKEHLPNEPRWPNQYEKEIEEINYEGTEIEKTVINRGTNALIVREFMEECIKDANGVLPGKIKPWCTQKDNFLILDCWDNFEYFKLNPRGKELKLQIPLPVRLFGVRLEKIGEAQTQNKTEIVEKEIQNIQKQIAALPKNSVVIMETRNDLKMITSGFLSPRQRLLFIHIFIILS